MELLSSYLLLKLSDLQSSATTRTRRFCGTLLLCDVAAGCMSRSLLLSTSVLVSLSLVDLALSQSL